MSSFISIYQGAMKAHKNGLPVSHHFPRWCPVADIIESRVKDYGSQIWCMLLLSSQNHASPNVVFLIKL